MKTLKNLLIIISFIIGVIQIDAQTSRLIEKRIGNTVYELDTIIFYIQNKANKISSDEIGVCLTSIENAELLYKDFLENFKSVFSKERAKQLMVYMSIRCTCDSAGKIHEVGILFKNRDDFEKFTLSEIKAIEEAAKKHRTKLRSWAISCEGVKYIVITYPFTPYLLYFERPKQD